MDEKKIKEVIDLVSKNTGIPENQLNIHSSSNNFARWDSLSQMKIVFEFEKIKNKKIKVSDLSIFSSIKEIVKLL